MSYIKFIILTAFCLLSLISCESSQEIQVGILWKDDPHFDESGQRYLAILKGECDFETGFAGHVLDFQTVGLAANETYYFSCSSNGTENYTAFVFADMNSDSSYNEGYDVVTGYKYNSGEPGDPLTISVSSFY